ncbi:MAG: molybdopterin biosynthesis protein MoeY, partial [Janthinobacterium lividum]|nr:molybdopterin biosynthesis protein MoeY [Janthinobacterium lividum]
ELALQCQGVLGAAVLERAVFFGRIGAGPAAQARSLRRPLQDLLVAPVDARMPA